MQSLHFEIKPVCLFLASSTYTSYTQLNLRKEEISLIIRDNVLTVGTKEFVIDLRFLYVIATMLILYCIISSRRVMQNVSILTIKKFYYCFWFAVYTFYINRIDFSYFNQDAVLALPVKIEVEALCWKFLLSLLLSRGQIL